MVTGADSGIGRAVALAFAREGADVLISCLPEEEKDGQETARLVEDAGIPTITNGMGRGLVPGGHPLLVTKARSDAFGGADLVVVVGTPLDFRLGYGVFGGKEEGSTPARVGRKTPTPRRPFCTPCRNRSSRNSAGCLFTTSTRAARRGSNEVTSSTSAEPR